MRTDKNMMIEALRFARKAWGRTHPNPMVGAIIADGTEIIASGYHKADGQPHAEIECLKSLKRPISGASTMYITLEPCSTKGRTGACTDAIISSGIRRVVVGALDPNPLHAGRGVDILRSAGIEVVSGVNEEECRNLNFIYNFTIQNAKAMLAIKSAQSGDGKIAAGIGLNTKITSVLADKNVHLFRLLFPAIATSTATVLIDDPSLTIRLEGEPVECHERLVFAHDLGNAEKLVKKKIFTDEFKDKTRIVAFADTPQDRISYLKDNGIRVMQLSAKRNSQEEFFDELKRKLFREGIMALYVEAGAKLLSAMLRAKAVDYAFIYHNGKNIGAGGVDAFTQDVKNSWVIDDPKKTHFPPDVMQRGYVKYL